MTTTQGDGSKMTGLVPIDFTGRCRAGFDWSHTLTKVELKTLGQVRCCNQGRLKEVQRAKYMLKASYTVEGTRGLMKEGGSRAVQPLQTAVEGMGGRMEVLLLYLGRAGRSRDRRRPDLVTITALSWRSMQQVAFRVSTSVLVTPEQIDEAAKKSVSYAPRSLARSHREAVGAA